MLNFIDIRNDNGGYLIPYEGDEPDPEIVKLCNDLRLEREADDGKDV